MEKTAKILIKITVTAGILLSRTVFPRGACRFHPTCSEYAQQVLEENEVCKALVLILWRLIRCNPFCEGGYDPVNAQSNPRGCG